MEKLLLKLDTEALKKIGKIKRKLGFRGACWENELLQHFGRRVCSAGLSITSDQVLGAGFGM